MAPATPAPTPSMVPVPIFGSPQTPQPPTQLGGTNNKFVILMITLIPTAIILALFMGIVHVARKRKARFVAACKLNPDIEMMARPPPAAGHTSPIRPSRPSRVDKSVPALPRVHSHVPSMYMGRSMEQFSPLASHVFSAADRPLSLFHPSGSDMKGKGLATPGRAYVRPVDI